MAKPGHGREDQNGSGTVVFINEEETEQLGKRAGERKSVLEEVVSQADFPAGRQTDCSNGWGSVRASGTS
jgi:hypothetical protein